jgi:uncharacterized integral membrane protein
MPVIRPAQHAWSPTVAVVSITAGKGKDGFMTSDPSVSPDRPPRATPARPAEPLPIPAPEIPPGTPPDVISPSKPADESPVKFTRAAALWSSLFVGFLILTVLLIFIAQNTESAQFAFLGWRWTLPLGVAILAAAVCGGLLTVVAGTLRIFQLRRAAKRSLKAGK